MNKTVLSGNSFNKLPVVIYFNHDGASSGRKKHFNIGYVDMRHCTFNFDGCVIPVCGEYHAVFKPSIINYFAI